MRDELPSRLSQAVVLSENRSRCRGAQAYEDCRLDQREFILKPRPADPGFHLTRFFVNPALPALLELKVLDRIRKIYSGPINSSFRERTVQQPTGRSHKRMALPVFFVARLFAYKNDS